MNDDLLTIRVEDMALLTDEEWDALWEALKPMVRKRAARLIEGDT